MRSSGQLFIYPQRLPKEEDDSDLDLEKNLQSIGDYIRERHEMNEQLFHCLRGPTLQRYVPDVLKVRVCN